MFLVLNIAIFLMTVLSLLVLVASVITALVKARNDSHQISAERLNKDRIAVLRASNIDEIIYYMKKVIKNNFPHIQTQIFKKIMVCKRIVILGDGNRFALLLCQKALTYLGYPCEIPVYLGSEEEIIDQFHLKEDDLVIIVSLHDTYDDFCTNRSVFYQNANYLDVKIKPKIGFIGVAPKDNHLYFNYNINQESFDKSMNELQVFFLNLVQYILYNQVHYQN